MQCVAPLLYLLSTSTKEAPGDLAPPPLDQRCGAKSRFPALPTQGEFHARLPYFLLPPPPLHPPLPPSHDEPQPTKVGYLMGPFQALQQQHELQFVHALSCAPPLRGVEGTLRPCLPRGGRWQRVSGNFSSLFLLHSGVPPQSLMRLSQNPLLQFLQSGCTGAWWCLPSPLFTLPSVFPSGTVFYPPPLLPICRLLRVLLSPSPVPPATLPPLWASDTFVSPPPAY